MQLAASGGNAAAVEVLIAAGSSLDVRDSDNEGMVSGWIRGKGGVRVRDGRFMHHTAPQQSK